MHIHTTDMPFAILFAMVVVNFEHAIFARALLHVWRSQSATLRSHILLGVTCTWIWEQVEEEVPVSLRQFLVLDSVHDTGTNGGIHKPV